MSKTDYMTVLEIKATAGTAVGTIVTFIWSEAGVIYFAGLGSGIVVSYVANKIRYARKK